ncbi:Crp/Fnr family transcriptional regulator [Paenibacillus sp. JX-17]|uniref:Crp/Fnr family transcriptional regulator n=1 Tax=Paenibacillus lacisoli TaxID=3064525 RepID=A0ABT9C9E7_9BACL|nr:Crp/Fnr family transcriptional regulator [Paenibacillus sp. JX-17]MDO7905884.1 Crp/Fnr family transcriptional regulator [Paenibacillus sp. JX-17]
MDIMQHRKVRAGATILREGERAGELYLIQSGNIQLRKTTEDGKEMILFIHQKGDLIGDFSELDGVGSLYTAEVLTNGSLGVIRVTDLQNLLSREGQMAVQLMKWMGDQQRIQQSRLLDLLLQDKTGALASTLIRASNSFGIPLEQGIMINMKLNHTILGELIGATRECVCRMLVNLREQGTIEVADGRLIICDLEKLRHLCGYPGAEEDSAGVCRL